MDPANDSLTKEQTFHMMQEKFFQVLRIKKTLEDRRESIFKQLKNPSDIDDVLTKLNSLIHIYKKEIKVGYICEHTGIKNAIIAIEQAETELIQSEKYIHKLKTALFKKFGSVGAKATGLSGNAFKFGFDTVRNPKSALDLINSIDPQGLFQKFSSKWKNFESKDVQILPLFKDFKLMFSYLKAQIIFLEKNMGGINHAIDKQFNLILEMHGYVHKTRVWEDSRIMINLKELERWHQLELDYIKEVMSEARFRRNLSSVINKINVNIGKVNVLLSQNKKVGVAQAIMVPYPSTLTVAAVGSLFLSPAFFPLYFGIGTLLTYSPTLFLLGKIVIQKIKMPEVRLPKFNLPQIPVPNFNFSMHKFQMPAMPHFDNANRLQPGYE